MDRGTLPRLTVTRKIAGFRIYKNRKPGGDRTIDLLRNRHHGSGPNWWYDRSLSTKHRNHRTAGSNDAGADQAIACVFAEEELSEQDSEDDAALAQSENVAGG